MGTDENQTGWLDKWITGLMDAPRLPIIQQSNKPTVLGLSVSLCVRLWLKHSL